MSLTNVSLFNIVYKQYRYKLNAYIGVFTALMVVQVLAILLSLIGMGYSSFSNNLYTVELSVSSPNLVIILTMIWAFMNAILITTKAYREDDFTFVTNRLSYNLSNMAFLFTACIIGAATALLSIGVIRILFYFTTNIDIFLTITQEVTLGDYIAGILVTVFYILMAAMAGYLIGMMTQFNKGLIIIIPVILVGLNYVAKSDANPGYVNILEFYFVESSPLLFIVKSLATIILGCLLAILLSNRLEVRR